MFQLMKATQGPHTEDAELDSLSLYAVNTEINKRLLFS